MYACCFVCAWGRDRCHVKRRSRRARPQTSHDLHNPRHITRSMAASAVDAIPEDFDLETYASAYSKYGLINRLVFLARCAGFSSPVGLQALRRALAELKKSTSNAKLYRELFSVLLNADASAASELDESWIEATERSSARTLERLNAAVNNARTNLIKESIRMSLNDLGMHFIATGNFAEARRNFQKTAQHKTNEAHTFDRDMKLITVDLASGSLASLTSVVSSARRCAEASANPVTAARLSVYAGLGHLATNNLRAAALAFAEVTGDFGPGTCEEVSPQDVALYGTLCGLATLSRADLKKKIVDSASFRQLLELVPSMREAAMDFLGSRYASCFGHLNRLAAHLRLDPFVHGVLSALLNDVSRKALVQYATPFLSVDLNRMAAAFDRPLELLERQVAELIADGQLHCRIDSHTKLLYARQDDERASTFASALAMGEAYERNAKAMLLRVNLLRSGFVLRAPSASRARFSLAEYK